MSSFSATASSSSSQSSRLSWQPSQDANFHTANRGRARLATSDLANAENPGDAVKAEDRSVTADESGPELTMPAQPNRAFHIALHRQIDPVRRKPAIAQRIDRESHHNLGSAHHGHRVLRIDRSARDQRRHDPDIAAPIPRGMVDGDDDVDIETPPPRFELAPVEDIGRATRAIEQDDPAVMLAAGEYEVERRAEWRQTEPAGDDDDIAAFALRDRPI